MKTDFVCKQSGCGGKFLKTLEKLNRKNKKHKKATRAFPKHILGEPVFGLAQFLFLLLFVVVNSPFPRHTFGSAWQRYRCRAGATRARTARAGSSLENNPQLPVGQGF